MRYKLMMFLLVFSLFFITKSAAALEMKANVYSEIGGETLNTSSLLNPNNCHSLNEFEYFLRGNLTVKSDLGETSSGLIKLEYRYTPASFDPAGQENSSASTDEIFIKEMYLNFLFEECSLRVGKQYVKWGSSSFFNPIDVINLRRDPLQSLDEAEGNPFIYFSIPIRESLSMDLFSVVKEQTQSWKDLPVIVKCSFSGDKLSGFCFIESQKGYQPIYGVDFEYAFTLNEVLSGVIYGEGSYKSESLRKVMVQNGASCELQPLNSTNYPAYVLGTKFDRSFSELKGLDGISWVIEYYYDGENWNHNQFQTYLECLDTLKSDISAHQKALGYLESFRNSNHYLYSSVLFHGLLKNDLQAHAGIIFNLEDGSNIFIPDISYSLSNTNAQLGIKALFYSGTTHSEFGANPACNKIISYCQISF